MEIQMIDINKITPDKNQPRQTIDMVRVHEMAKSILTEGVINPIEIDEKNIIVTGEIRWRSAKEAGLKQVPCKVVHYEGRERFRRQTIENIHHNTMTAMDTAEALDQLVSTANGVRHPIGYGELLKLSVEIGKTDRYIQDHLNLVKESPEVREYLRRTDAKYSFIRDINQKAPKEFAEELKLKVVKGEINNWHIAMELSKALKVAPEKKDELFSHDWSQAKDKDMKEVYKIVPIATPVDSMEESKEVTRIARYLMEAAVLFKEHTFTDFSSGDVAQLKVAFTRAVEEGNVFFSPTSTGFIKGELT